MKHIGLFEGIGGFSYAAQLMGWQTVAWCEWKPFCQTVLRYHFPEAEGFGDITKTDFSKYANTIDILTGGFPCQPFSVAGNQAGVEDDRHLWPQMRRAIREIKPRIIVAENVAGLFTVLEPTSLSEMESKEIQLFSEDENCQINSTIQRLQRRVIATIIEEIRAEGYVLPTLADGTPIICCIPACGVNAPHRRDRVWFVAHRANAGLESVRFGGKDTVYGFEPTSNAERQAGKSGDNGREKCIPYNRKEIRLVHSSGGETSPNPNSRRQPRKKYRETKPRRITETDISGDWSNFPTQSPLRCGDDGISSRLVGITVSKHRNESIKAYGNAIVPQVALQIFKAIAQYEND